MAGSMPAGGRSLIAPVILWRQNGMCPAYSSSRSSMGASGGGGQPARLTNRLHLTRRGRLWRAGVLSGKRFQREPRSVTKHYIQVITPPGCVRHAGTVPRRLKEEAMEIIETEELVPSCHRPEVVETSELQPTCHS